jgi:glycosyltransferase involved in cell wall biosynthesis
VSEIPFIHLAPKDTSRTGIASYADTLHAALTKYAPSLSLIRVDASEFLARLSTFPKGAIVWAELGVNEGEIFRALRLQKHIRPDFKRFITIHDSPRFVHSPFKFLEQFGKSFPLRAFRRAFNLAFEPLMLRHALQPNDTFICLTTVGRDALQHRLQRLLRRNFQVLVLPHLLYLDEPLPKRRKHFSAPLQIGFFGFITPNKGLHLLIDAALLLLNSNKKTYIPRLIIRGCTSAQYQPYLESQREKVVRAGLTEHITFGDFLADDEIPRFLGEIDFLALPYDTPPVIAASGILQWARTYGVPVVASATPAFQSLITHNHDGILIPNNTPAEWATFFERLSTQQINSDALSQGIQEKQHEASWKSVSTKVMSIIQE